MIFGLFDHDGTVADSEQPALEAAGLMINDLILKVCPRLEPYALEDFISRFAGLPLDAILENVANERAGLRISLEAWEQIVAEEERMVRELLSRVVEETPHTTEVLESLRRLGVEFALVTSSLHGRIAACFERTGHQRFFPLSQDPARNRVFSARDSLSQPRPKPDPAIYQHAMTMLGVQLETDVAFAVEDTSHGVQSAIYAGISHVFGYLGGGHIAEQCRFEREQELKVAGAFRVLNDMRELPEMVEEIAMIEGNIQSKVL